MTNGPLGKMVESRNERTAWEDGGSGIIAVAAGNGRRHERHETVRHTDCQVRLCKGYIVKTVCIVCGRRQGRRHGFLSGWTNRRQVVNLRPNYPKNRKDTGFGPFYSRIWGSPLLRFSLRGRVLPSLLSTPMGAGLHRNVTIRLYNIF